MIFNYIRIIIIEHSMTHPYRVKNIVKSMKNMEHHSKFSRRRWTLTYKKSIDCKHPKGFSQRQHCKYGRKKLTSKIFF